MNRRAWLILGWGIILLTIVDAGYLFSISSYSTNKYIHSNNEANHNQKRLDGPVLSVLIETFDTIECIIDRHEKLLTILSTIAIAFFTATLWRSTSALESSATQQGNDMRDSIREAGRSATAMEKVATATINNANLMQSILHQQMRAYISVIIGGAIFQERSKNLRFAGKPRIVNTGHTPAHKVGFKIRAGIFSNPLPIDFDFKLPDEIIGAHVIGTGHFNDITGIVDDYVSDDQVGSIKTGNESALFVWGIVFYEDVFGEPHETRFCQSITWIGKGETETVLGYYNSRHNEAT